MQHDSAPAPTTYLVVGAGPFGLIAARALLRAGVEIEVYERGPAVGGIWDMDNPGSPMYSTCHFITSKQLGGFIDYRMPERYPMYPHWTQVRDYIRAFAKDSGVEPFITFGKNVVATELVEVGGVDAWKVTTTDGATAVFRGIVYAGGQQWKPFKPSFPGEDGFQGEVITSNLYKGPEQFHGKKVLVVGAGNSGVDIAVDAAEYADLALLSTRRAYHFLPKQIFGVPTPDLLTGKAKLPQIPGIDRELEPPEIAALAIASVGDLTKVGLPEPDMIMGSVQQIVSDLAVHFFSHGLLHHRWNIKQFGQNTVEFEDGTVDELDLVVFATGYDIDIPWLPDGALDYEEGHPHFHVGGIALNVPNLYAIGVLHPSRADAYAVFDQLFQVAVNDITATLTGDNAAAAAEIRETYRPDLKKDWPFINTRRNVNQASDPGIAAFLDDLENRFGIEVPGPDNPGFYQSPAPALAVQA